MMTLLISSPKQGGMQPQQIAAVYKVQSKYHSMMMVMSNLYLSGCKQAQKT